MYVYVDEYLNSRALGLGHATFASLLGPGEVCDGDDEEGVAVERHMLVTVGYVECERRKNRIGEERVRLGSG